MSRLPPELWTPILQQVHRTSRDDLLSCMQANQQLCEIGFPILYRNVSLRLKDILLFERAIRRFSLVGEESGELEFPFVRCLRLVVPGDGRDYGYGGLKAPAHPTLPSGVDTIAERGVQALIRCMSRLTRVRTFSIVTYSGHRLNTWDEQGLPPPESGAVLSASSTRARGPNTNVLAQLVQALPPSIRNLSIDLSELSRYEPMPNCTLCPAISAKISQLEHLNMHLRSYCGQLLVSAGSSMEYQPDYRSLQSVIMRIHGFSARLCARTSQTGILNLDGYTRNIKHLLHSGQLPNLQQFSIISKRRPLGIRQHADAKWYELQIDMQH